MNYLAITDMNIFSAIVPGIVYFLTNEYHATESRTKSSFKNLTLSVLFLILMDLAWAPVNGRDGMVFFYLNNLINFFRIGFSVLPSILWVKYVFERINFPSEKIRRYTRNSTGIFMMILVLTAMSPLFGVFYRINPNNIYSRGPLYSILIVITLCYMLTGAYMIIMNKDYYQFRKTASLLSFFVLPLLGMFIQFMYFGVTLIWNFSTISILLFT